MQDKILSQGAEAIIHLVDNKFLKENTKKTRDKIFTQLKKSPAKKYDKGGFKENKSCEQSEEQFIIKQRISKSYRLPEIDNKLRKLRTRSEAKIIEKLKGKLNVPEIISVDENKKEIIMQYIKGKKLSENLDNLLPNQQLKIMREIGKQISIMHDNNIIHGDLTTSNIILIDEDNKTINKQSIKTLGSDEQHKNFTTLTKSDAKPLNISEANVFFIDFGLSFHSSKIEDRAVDLHLLKQALEAKHFKNWGELFEEFLKSYNPEKKQKILEQLKKVEARGRYKH